MLVETDFLASGNHFFPWSHIFFKKSFIPISRSDLFSPKEWYCFSFRAFFPASENRFLNYGEAYLKPLFLLLATVFLSSFGYSCQWKQFFGLIETYSWTNCPFQLVETGFLSIWNIIPLFRDFFTVCGKWEIQFLKNNLVSADANWFSSIFFLLF